ncbi:MAG TPA: hypothetical protein VE973_03330, partial [Candidatus Limnocylindria bacterium]|nr:hypothetical protein [Candidatus Limnocylindria bacterium]
VSHLIFGLSLFGVGMALVFAPINNLILSAVPVEQSGEASGVNNTLRQVGATLGAAIIGAAVLASLSAHLAIGINNSQVIPQAYKPQIIEQIAGPNSNAEFGSSTQLPAGTPPIVAQEIHELVNQSATSATQDAYVYSALFCFIGFLIAMFLPKMHTSTEENYAPQESSIPKSRFVLAGVVAALAVGGAALLLHNSANAVVSTGLVNADVVRQNFVVNNIATSSPQVLGETTPTPYVPISTRGPEVAEPVSPPHATTNTTQPISQPTIYTNPSLGFQTKISELWQANPEGKNMVVFTNAQYVDISVQSYTITNETLDTIKTQLQGSPSVSNIKNTTFKGQPALSFTSSHNQGIAVIYNGRLFYIMGFNLDQEPVTNFLFL